jgi:hypothetical protein
MKWLAIAVLACACKSEPADRAADRVREQQHALEDLSRADADFHARRDARIAELDSAHAAIAAQPKLIAVFAAALPLTDAGRATLDDKLHVVQVRLDETANLIEALRHTESDLWKQREAQVAAAMRHLDEARDAAWKAVGDAPRIHTSS